MKNILKNVLGEIFGKLGSILRNKIMISIFVAILLTYCVSSNLPDIKYEVPTPTQTVIYRKKEQYTPTPTSTFITPTPIATRTPYCKELIFPSGYRPPCPKGWGFFGGEPCYWRYNEDTNSWEVYRICPDCRPPGTPTPTPIKIF